MIAGLQCSPHPRSVVGEAGCVCGCEDRAIPTEDCEVCSQGQNCYHDPQPIDEKSHYCVEACKAMPSYNVRACYCHHEVCDQPYWNTFCQPTSGCRRFDQCDDTSMLYNHTHGHWEGSADEYDLEFCVCGYWEQIKLCDESQYCISKMNSENKTEYSCIPRPTDCPPEPSLSPEGGCSCRDREVCEAGQMCASEAGKCVERPPDCQPLPSVAGPERCYCAIQGLTTTPQICEEFEASAQTNSKINEYIRILLVS